ncbi:MAG: hypothetical protein CMC76_01110 [Flavobacteriaceae bacterium]|nr:hypothetical protein [Flavobacteriaceae bacterium]|tara:strand:- start:1825 stop:2586 length:762 start_codon:yes stop_codon:yes gene_type:complete
MLKINTLKFLLLILICLTVNSCGTIVLSLIGANAKEVKPITIKNGEKNVVFIPMHHVGKKEFYNSVYLLTDSLGKKGYKAYYELIKPLVPSDTVYNRFNYKKLRKLMSRQLAKGGHIDTVTYKLSGRIKISNKYINQPQPKALISDISNPLNIDVSLDDLIKKYETDYGEIKLDSCDMNTGIYQEYKCQGIKVLVSDKYKIFKQGLIRDFRDKHLAEYVHNSDDSKIIVIYGKAHYNGFLRELQAIDPTWNQE